LELPSNLWLDQPDAHERIDRLGSDGQLADDEAAALHTFVDAGYLHPQAFHMVERTRPSLIVHYSTAATTERVITRAGSRRLDNPQRR
jgi:hypothetical protein